MSHPTDEQLAAQKYSGAVVRMCDELMASPNFRKFATSAELEKIKKLRMNVVLQSLGKAEVSGRRFERIETTSGVAVPGMNSAAVVALMAAALVGAAGIAGQNMSRRTGAPESATPLLVEALASAAAARAAADKLLAETLRVADRAGAMSRAAVVRALQVRLTSTAVALAGAAAAGSAAEALSRLAPQAALWGQAAAITGAALAVKLDDLRDAFVGFVAFVEELIRNLPPGGPCDDRVGAYNKAKAGVEKAFEGLAASINDISKNEYIKANKAFQKAVNDLLNCLGFDSLF